MKAAALVVVLVLAGATQAKADYTGKTPPEAAYWETKFAVNNDRVEYQGRTRISENEYIIFVNVYRGSNVPQPTRIMAYRMDDGRWIVTGLYGAYSAGMQKILK
ncbi:hypothetical protein [Oceanibaculum indicum]|uniref:DUF3828 domain-containing protein n=1 Tax=Oceanibaculum indicum TaxID=526216 RepID=A0A420WGR6_9PROT|nr:hypothetical protein [Oceanibaculum indicum]RKQ70152.1 hypothetical protein BCL74_2092 [Oceanibaculum indicum]